jgi:hypothetical protein
VPYSASYRRWSNLDHGWSELVTKSSECGLDFPPAGVYIGLRETAAAFPLYAVNKAVRFVPYVNMHNLAETSVTEQHWSVRKQGGAVRE